ncbi:hypothetical protein ACWGDT_12760 [Streptomyces avermitilis]
MSERSLPQEPACVMRGMLADEIAPGVRASLNRSSSTAKRLNAVQSSGSIPRWA